jgi:hypothetical protein
MKAYLALVMVTLGVFGCGAQALPGGAHDAGRDLSRPVIDASGRVLDDAGCPPEGKMTCGPYGGCAGSNIIVAPVCLEGSWTCTMIVPIICPVDAGPRDAATDVVRDAATRCAWPVVDAGRYFNCGGCGSDSTPPPTCLDGAWTCPTGWGVPTVCPPTVRRCVGPQPSGCSCNPITGAAYCTHDAGADAPSNETGIGPG